MPLITLLALVLCLASVSINGVSAKSVVRGAHRPKTLKHFSMHARQLMEDKNKDKDDDKEEDDDKEDDKEQEADEKDKDDDEEEESEEEPTDDEMTDPPVIEGAEGEETEVPEPEVDTETEGSTEMPMADNTTSTVALEPFSLTVDGAIDEEDLNLDQYLLTYMSAFMPSLIAIDLTSTSVVEESSGDDMDTTADNTTRSLRSYQATVRFLAVQTFYYEGTATFEGEAPSAADVDTVLTQALSDTDALQAHLVASAPDSNATVTGAVPGETSPAGATGEIDVDDEDDGLSTTGLSIVIVASCVGGISLLIIVMVGLSGPSGNTAGLKGGLPEQPLQ